MPASAVFGSMELEGDYTLSVAVSGVAMRISHAENSSFVIPGLPTVKNGSSPGL